MSTNASSVVLLTLESLGLSNVSMYPAFLLGTLTYLFIMLCNLLVLLAIVHSKKLQKPMFILLLNLPISDMVGATAFFPHIMLSIVTQNRLISHPACVIQAFLIHVYGTGNLLILTAMAYDRYIAICCPLRYNTIMSPNNLIKILVIIWLLNLSLMGTLIAMLSRFKLCRTHIVDLYCNNPSLLKLVCGDTRVNNYFGLFTIAIIQGGPLVVILYTYGQILRTCVMNSQPDARRKAIQTCGTHLVVCLILEINTFVTLIAHRIDSVSPFMRRALGVSVLVFPPFFDPIIYGLKTAELKESIKMLLRRNIGATKPF
ncbi:putative gustatory receptor clone PTE01 [Notolabrus celidotus]|uniref:putative gustatory receptor clone PTE01 n=1 Tax=Notolabrus celidotus TaxID=1203425 RepID=UPI00148FD2C3|nr:putative gustatory receptor clone PTE01 [Notolabrus celidotus]